MPADFFSKGLVTEMVYDSSWRISEELKGIIPTAICNITMAARQIVTVLASFIWL